MRLGVACCLVACAIPLACGGGGDNGDGGSDASPDHFVVDVQNEALPDVAPDVPIDNWAAPLPPYARMPIVDYNGGALLTSVKIITVSFAGDDAALITRLQELDDTITSTAWWAASTAEYCMQPNGPCIGPGAGAGHVVLNETAPASLVDTNDGKGSSVVSFIQSHITSGAFPPPEDQTIYVIYFPSGTNIQFGGDKSCSSFGAYHYSATFNLPDAGTQEGAYAIEPRCTGEPYITLAASHELIEAATDAHPGKDRGYAMGDLSWQFYGDEVGDLCDHPWSFDSMTVDTIDGGQPFTVQRGWSNLSALAGHDPCVIPPGHPYFNTAVQSGDQAIYMSVGDTKTIQVQGFSDGAMGDWTISAIDMGNHYGAGSVLTLTLDTTTMNDGQTANLTITLNAQPKITWIPYVIDNVYKTDAGAQYEHQWGASVYLQ
jgi:hypothetical protein